VVAKNPEIMRLSGHRVLQVTVIVAMIAAAGIFQRGISEILLGIGIGSHKI
jgi:hypothetical protein